MGYNIAIVEDDSLILELLAGFLKSSQKFDNIHTYNSGSEFLNAMKNGKQDLDVILLDFRLGEMDAEFVLEELQEQSIEIPSIILTSNYSQYLIGYMVRIGASAYLPKNIQPRELIVIMEEVIKKGHYISSEQFPFLKITFSEEAPNFSKQVLNFNNKDIELIYLLAKQLTAKEISDKLYVSPKTVEGYKNSLFARTKTKTVVGLVLFAVRNGLININSLDFD